MEQGSYTSGDSGDDSDESDRIWSPPSYLTIEQEREDVENELGEEEADEFDQFGFACDSGSGEEAEAEAGREPESVQRLNAALDGVLRAAAAASRPSPGHLHMVTRSRGLDRDALQRGSAPSSAATASQAVQGLAAAAGALEFGGLVRKTAESLAAALVAAEQPADVVVLAEAAAALADIEACYSRVRSCMRTRALCVAVHMSRLAPCMADRSTPALHRACSPPVRANHLNGAGLTCSPPKMNTCRSSTPSCATGCCKQLSGDGAALGSLAARMQLPLRPCWTCQPSSSAAWRAVY